MCRKAPVASGSNSELDSLVTSSLIIELDLKARGWTMTHGMSKPGLGKAQTGIFAGAAGLSVANIYAAQPLLDAMAGEFGMSPAAIGLIVTLTQVGYALGLIAVVPLGDLLDRRRLILGQGLLSVVALIAVAMARTSGMLLLGLALVGLMAVMVQVLVAFAASLAAPTQRGSVVGTVTSGVVVGILAARFASGMIADVAGWRAVYAASAGLMLAMLCLLLRMLPRNVPLECTDGYLATIRSIPALFLKDKVLMGRGLLAFLIFAAFSTFWTALVMPLSAPPFDYSHGTIGLFGLVGMAGALAASGAGRLADKGFGRITTGASLALLTATWMLIAQLPRSIPLLLVGVIVLDLAVQAVHVISQGILFGRYPTAGSRLVGGYMVFYSLGSAVGGIFSTAAYAAAGWSGVCLVGAAFSAAALLGWAGAWVIGLRASQTDLAPSLPGDCRDEMKAV
jgi:predicted MFS family arabinose efflux permease